MSDEDICRKCHNRMVIKPLRPFPVLLQVIFGLSFVFFLWFFEQTKQHVALIWIWSTIQITMGFFLVRGRLLARKKIYRCVICTPDLR